VGETTWYVTQTAPNACVSPRAAVNVTVNFKAKFHIVADSFVCLYDSTGFAYNGTAPPPGAVYTWTAPRTTAITHNSTDSIVVVFDSIGNHEILLAVADDSTGRCESIDSQSIYVAPPPVANFTMPADGCIGQSINVTVTNGTPDITYKGYLWNFNNAMLISGTAPGPGPYTVSYAQVGQYAVSLLAISRYGCAAIDTITDTITIHPTPSAFIDSISALSVCTGDTVALVAGIYDPQNHYEWTPKSAFIVNGNTSRRDSAIIAVTTDIYLTVTTPYGCKDSSDDVITGQSCCGVYFPTAFSPGAGINKLFRPITVGHHKIEVFRIVNRWGQTVYTSDDEQTGWDGTVNGVPQEIGDYFWYIKYQCSNGTMTEDKGTVTLIR
jgi:gliding motility-associated-like protein